jgi:hypothetical protein
MSPSGSLLGGNAGDAAASEAPLAASAEVLSTGCSTAVVLFELLLLLLLIAGVREAACTDFDALAADFSDTPCELLLAVRLSSRENR